jgi:hypothetical protein
MKRLIVATALTAALSAASWAQTPAPAEHDSHHPSDSTKSGPAPANPAPAASQPGIGGPEGGMANMPMMGMMGDMKNMMSNMSVMHTMGMMQSMGMMGPGMAGMATMDRVEGRIAFLRAELKITDAQADAWNAFADALRVNARKLGEVGISMMSKPGEMQQGAGTISERLERQEQWLLARLEGTRAMKSAFTKLNETLSDDQRKTANELLAPHLGMGVMAMSAMQMQPGQMQRWQMEPGKMRPGQMQPPPTGNK